MRVSLRKLLVLGWQKLIEDYYSWQKARRELRKSAPPKIKVQPKTSVKTPAAAPIIQPQIKLNLKCLQEL